MSRWIVAAAIAAPLAARAQVITSTFQSTNPNGTRGSVNIGQSTCNNTASIAFNIDWSQTSPPPSSATGDQVEYWVTKDSATCSTNTAPAAGTGTDLGPGRLDVLSDSTSVPMTTLLQGLANLCNNTTATAATPYTTYFCVRRTTPTILNGGNFTSSFLAVQFALVPPAAPGKPSISPGDQHLKVSWVAVSGASTYDVYAVASGQTVDPNKPVKQNIANTSFDVTNTSDGSALQNGKDYDVYVRTDDAYKNVSGLSPAATEAPVQIDDFYARYRRDGGSAEGGGGCASGGGDLLAAAVALFAFAARRRRRGAVVVAAALLAPAAHAADWTGQDRPARHVLVAVKADRYDPQIDTEAGLTGRPYHDIFRGRAPARWQLEVDWEVAHPFGAILVGATGGFWQNFGHGIVTSSGQISTDTALLDVVPFGIVGTYRFDVLADRYRWLPFIPYAQAGLSAALWASTNGTGHVTTERGGRGSGWTYGYTTALGLAINLDAIDAELAREAYNDVGIQRTSLFAEYGWTRLDNFRKSGALILSDRAWRFGLSIEF